MLKQVVFIGGIHGAGKTSCCKKLSQEFAHDVAKQRHAVIALGKTMGLDSWEEIGCKHDKLILPAAELVTNNFLKSRSDVLLVDCHYAISAKKALRLNGKEVDSPFIPDLDYTFVAKMAENFRIRFIILRVEPIIGYKRIRRRPLEVLNYFNTLEGLEEIEPFETRHYHLMINHFEISGSDLLVVDSNKKFDSVTALVGNFVLK